MSKNLFYGGRVDKRTKVSYLRSKVLLYPKADGAATQNHQSPNPHDGLTLTLALPNSKFRRKDPIYDAHALDLDDHVSFLGKA
jgi:hypothetical protein